MTAPTSLPTEALLGLLQVTNDKMVLMEIEANTENRRFDTLCEQARQIHEVLRERGVEK